ncbi:MAG: N-acetylglucosaminyldiphosphoundecaprenol N-acetyl-beta-D-mannosaminyltransferase [Parcubacteria group bacterium GW2011_GWA2_38_13]|nr:MAG: N-acetylglucosaminyldiphosphoundecaprenol N-acetyl-beta-D-mannosaminyltransferase [Parcubacteria group bacterium GW2011_GWA2_38_13]
MKMHILGINIDNESRSEVIERIKRFARDGNKHHIVTPNPEFLVLARNDKEFKDIINKADISVADGFGLILASKFLYKKNLIRITGNDMAEILSQISAENNYPIFFLGGERGVAEKASQKLLQKFPNMRVAGTIDEKIFRDPKNIDREVIDAINLSKAKILFVALPHGKQEKLIYYNLPKFQTVVLAIGIGGVFDFLSGNRKRAPLFMQRIGLEWLYRLMQEPKRWKRIYNAVIVFPLLIFYEKFHNKKN